MTPVSTRGLRTGWGLVDDQASCVALLAKLLPVAGAPHLALVSLNGCWRTPRSLLTRASTTSLAFILKSTAPTTAAKIPTTAPESTTTTTTTTITKATLLPRTGLVDSYCAPGIFFAVERSDCSLSFCIGRHFHKGKSPRAARIAIPDDGNLLYLAVGFEGLAQLLFVHLVSKVPHVYSQFQLLSNIASTVGCLFLSGEGDCRALRYLL